MAAWDRLDTGTRIADRYEIFSRLARGGYGAVYVAGDAITEKQVALKVLDPRLLDEPATSERFMLEARVAGRVGSEHIVQVFDAGMDNGLAVPFLVMELLRGRSRKSRRARGAARSRTDRRGHEAGGIRARQGSWVAWTGSDGQRPIVHRDLKPANLVLTHREDGTPLVKILDFGIAKVLAGIGQVQHGVQGDAALHVGRTGIAGSGDAGHGHLASGAHRVLPAHRPVLLEGCPRARRGRWRLCSPR